MREANRATSSEESSPTQLRAEALGIELFIAKTVETILGLQAVAPSSAEEGVRSAWCHECGVDGRGWGRCVGGGGRTTHASQRWP